MNQEKKIKKNALVIRFSSFGDIILTKEAVRLLRQHGYYITFLTKKKFTGLVEEYLDVDSVISIENHASLREIATIAKNLKTINVVFDFHRNLRSIIIVTILRVLHFHIDIYSISKHRFKELILLVLKDRLFNFLFNNTLDRTKESLRLVNKAISANTNLSIKKIIKLKGHQLPRNQTGNIKIGIGPESAWAEKEWGEGKFSALIEKLRIDFSSQVEIYWIGLSVMPEPLRLLKVIPVVGESNIAKLGKVVESLDLMVCNDSGIMHFAEMLGVPVIAVFGPTTRTLGFAPKKSESIIIEKKLWCRPCSKTGKWCFRLKDKRKCLDITVDEVYFHLKQKITELC